jgi:hypothetical protein
MSTTAECAAALAVAGREAFREVHSTLVPHAEAFLLRLE